MGRATYLTARCPTGCEAWLHPKALPLHAEVRCRGHPWVDDLSDTAVVPDAYTELLLGLGDDVAVGVVDPGHLSRIDPGDGRCRHRPPTPSGVLRVHSPVPGVSARRWLVVALAAADRWGADGVRRAVRADGFYTLETELVLPGTYTECPVCGAFVAARVLGQHQRMSATCWWQRAAAEVRAAWRDGWRDPYTVPGAPTTWTDLSRSAGWRRRLRTVPFPRWIAVLVSPATPRAVARGTTGKSAGFSSGRF